MSILILAEHDSAALKAATLSTIAAAKKLDLPIDLLVLGEGIDAVATQAKNIEGLRKIILGDNAVFKDILAETFSQAVLALAGEYSFILVPATTFGKNILPRVAAKLDIQQISDVIDIESPQRFVRPVYAGNAIQTIETAQEKNILTIRPTSFNAVALGAAQDTPVEKKEFSLTPPRVRFVGIEASKADRPDLSSARIVVSGGRGVGSKENFKIIEELADRLGAAIGASRAAVDAGYVPNDYQVGQTGKIIAPDLYIAIGISGAIQHLAGMVGSKVIVAINKDPDAPIFQVADYGLVGDLFTILPELHNELQK
ncbi:MAG: electron transfer flavoprotein subunit beta [Alphaproteobacteria bacterium]|nr:electron transfer flavoprotein subunit beta [Alphaproteobacteria bacterium]